MRIQYLIIFVLISLITGCRPSTGTSGIDGKSRQNIAKLKVVIEQVVNEDSFDIAGNKTIGIGVNVLLVNTSEETIELAYSRWLDSALFTISNKNLTLMGDGHFPKTPVAKMTIIKPREYQWAMLFFKYRKTPEQPFKFKVGFHNLNWSNYRKKAPSDVGQIEKAEILWSDEQTFNPKGSHLNHKDSLLEYKKRAEILFPPLNSLQQKNYILSVGKRPMIKHKNSECAAKGTLSFKVPVRLSNNSNDTLEYTDMSCDWGVIFTTNNPLITIESKCMCLGNAPANYRIAPHKDIIYYLPVNVNALAKPGTHFKLRMVLIKAENLFQLEGFDYQADLVGDPKYTIWSDDIELPKHK